jgi:hypothetical protein
MSISNGDRINALASLYAAERADLSTIGNQLTGVSGLAVTYIVAIFIVLGHTDPKQMSLLWFAAPIPVFIFLAFYALFLSLSMARTASCKRLEEYIAVKAEVKVDEIGMSISESVLDIKRAKSRWHKGLIASAYAPILIGSGLVIVYLVIQAFHHDANIWVRVISMVIYAFLLIPIAVGWYRIGRGRP